MVRKAGNTQMNMLVPQDLYDMFSKLCIDLGITRNQAIVRYFHYLQKQHYKKRRLLDEESTEHFDVGA